MSEAIDSAERDPAQPEDIVAADPGAPTSPDAAAPEGTEPWDCVALVRYRSRRDFLRLCADLVKGRADIHKWAAIEATQGP